MQQEFLAVAAPGILWQRDGCQNRQTTTKAPESYIFQTFQTDIPYAS